MMDYRISLTDARGNFPRVIDLSRTQAVFLERRGETAAVVISPAQYERMVDAMEEADDIAAFDAAVAEADSAIPWDQVKADLGWA